MRRLVYVLWFTGTSSLVGQQIALDELGTAPWLDYEWIVRAQLTAYEGSSQGEAFRSLLSGYFTMRFAGENRIREQILSKESPSWKESPSDR